MSKLTNIVYQPLFLVLVTALSLVFSWSLWKTARRSQRSAQNLQQVEKTVAEEKRAVENLQQELSTAQEPLTQEKIMRDELLLQKPGEYVVQIAEEDLAKILATSQEQSQVKRNEPWVEWKKLLF